MNEQQDHTLGDDEKRRLYDIFMAIVVKETAKSGQDSPLPTSDRTFRNDHLMPLFSVLEGPKAFELTELLLNIHDAQETGIDYVKSGYKTLTVDKAKELALELIGGFMQTVRNETQRREKVQGDALDGRALERAKDMVASHANTAYIGPDHD